MAESITLRKPLTINGKKKSKLTYDAELITGEQYIEACRKSASPGEINIAEADYALHFYLGCEAIIAKNPDIDLSDLERVTGTDLMKISTIGRNFTLSAAEDYEDETSEEPTGSTGDTTTPAKQTSDAVQ